MYSSQGIQSKDQLVERHAELVKRIAYHLLARLPASVQVDDLIQAGMIGLLDASNQYDAGQGAAFETYASIRVRGAMLDELRRNDWAPKSLHRKSRELAAAIRQIEMETGRDASDQEVANKLGISMDEYFRILQETANCKMVSLDELVSNDGATSQHGNNPDDTPQNDLLESEFQENLSRAIEGLPEREKLIVSLYYDQELNLREIDSVLGVSESRVSQLMSQAHKRLRARMDDFL